MALSALPPDKLPGACNLAATATLSACVPDTQVLHELLDMLRLQGQAQHSDFLEIIIILLICVGEAQLLEDKIKMIFNLPCP